MIVSSHVTNNAHHIVQEFPATGNRGAAKRGLEQRFQILGILPVGDRFDGVGLKIAVPNVRDALPRDLGQHAANLLVRNSSLPPDHRSQRLSDTQQLGTQPFDVEIELLGHRRRHQDLNLLLGCGQGLPIAADQLPGDRRQRNDADEKQHRQHGQNDMPAALESSMQLRWG